MGKLTLLLHTCIYLRALYNNGISFTVFFRYALVIQMLPGFVKKCKVNRIKNFTDFNIHFICYIEIKL